MDKRFLYLMVILYLAAGIYHFINPEFYFGIMPEWLPAHRLMNYLSGAGEVVLALLLLPAMSRKISICLISAMLIVFFFVIHIPMAVKFYDEGATKFLIAVLRLPVQAVLLWWCWKLKKLYC